MRELAKAVPIVLMAVALAALYLWLRGDPATGLEVRLAIPENVPQEGADEDGTPQWEDVFEEFDGVAASLPGAWPRFRGRNLDGISAEDMPLARTWPVDGPSVLWSIDFGEGYAGAAVLAGRVYVLDYDQEKKGDAIRCFSLADGREIWRYSYPVKIRRQHGMSRTVPAVTQRYVVTMGPKCHVTCLDSVTGDLRWKLNLVRDYSTVVPDWYTGQCPLIDDGKAIIAPAGKALMMAVDCETGETLWESPNPQNWQMTHSSVVPVEFAGRRMYVYCASGGVVGISAEDGGILWEFAQWQIRVANVPTPVVIGDGMIFLSGGYNAGSLMLKLSESGGQITAEEVFRLRPEVFGAEQQTPIFYQEYIYGVRPDGQLTCLEPSGQVVWTSTSAHKFELGPYIIADGLIYVMNDSGLLTLAEATPTGYVQLAEAKVLEGPDAWGPMAIAGGRLILRDLNRMICLDVAER
ncbi:MAG: PQQ-binding-like beta-propeller repeat protein [Planctomycetota bacterium]|jgi:outer membrane protein assembly factor BamB